jgi:hypothetical protein
MDLVGVNGPIRSDVPVGRLTSQEWIWVISTVVWGWVATRGEQASTEGWNHERAIRTTGLTPDPWTMGAVTSILPQLADACSDLDWSRPVGEWTKDDMAEFLLAGFNLIMRALEARGAIEDRIAGTEMTNANATVRQMNRVGGNLAMTADEASALDDDSCPLV